jgi:hypothetical protein
VSRLPLRRQTCGHLGFVVGRRGAGALRATSGLCDEACALARARAAAARLFVSGLFASGTTAPEATRDECLVRCLVFFGAAASAVDESAKAAMSATTSIFIVLRIRSASGAGVFE